MSGRGKTQRQLHLGPLSFTSKAPKQLTQKQLSKAIANNAFLRRVANINPLQAEILAERQAVRNGNIKAVLNRLEKVEAKELAKSIKEGPNSAAIRAMFSPAPPVTTAAPYTLLHDPNFNPSENGGNNNNWSKIISGYPPPKKGGKQFRKTRKYRKSRRS